MTSLQAMRAFALLLCVCLVSLAACGEEPWLARGSGAGEQPADPKGAGGSDGTGPGHPTPGGWPGGGDPAPDIPRCAHLALQGHICHDGFCWMQPGQQGLDLAALHASGDQVRAVGRFGTIQLRAGDGWVREPSGTHAHLLAIDGAAGDLWAAGTGGTVLRRMHGHWKLLPRPTEEDLHTVAVTRAGEAWVASDSGIFRWHGGGWMQIRRTEGARIGMDRGGTLWATFDGALHRHDGQGLVLVATTNAVLATHRFHSPLVIEEETGRLSRWQGGRFHLLFDGPWRHVIQIARGQDGGFWLLAADRRLDGASYGHSVGRLEATGLHPVWEESWTRWHQELPAMRALIPTRRGILVVGDAGRWVRIDEAGEVVTSDVEGYGASEAIPLGDQELVAWKMVFPGAMTVYRWTRRGWAPHAPASIGHGTGLGGTSDDDLWVSSHRSLIHWDGNRTETFTAGYSYSAVLALARDDVWAVGSSRVIAHWDGTAWHEIDVGHDVSLHGIWASGPKDVRLVGNTILHWDGETWSVAEGAPDPRQELRIASISGAGPDDVWAAGRGALFHWDGEEWSRVPAPEGVERVWTAGGDNVFLFSKERDARAWKKAEDGWQRLPFNFHANLVGPPSRGTFLYKGQPGRFCVD